MSLAMFYLSLSLVVSTAETKGRVKCRARKREKEQGHRIVKKEKERGEGKDRFIVALSECKFKMTKRNVTGADTNDWVA